MTFLVTVNNSYKWVPPFDNGSYVCTTTIKTHPLTPDTPLKEADKYVLGNCDNGSLVYSMKTGDDGNSIIVPTFYSTYMPQATPPSCNIEWNYTYLLPAKVLGRQSSVVANESLLPGCVVTDSWDNVHTTVYWFHILKWEFKPSGTNSTLL